MEHRVKLGALFVLWGWVFVLLEGCFVWSSGGLLGRGYGRDKMGQVRWWVAARQGRRWYNGGRYGNEIDDSREFTDFGLSR